MSEKWEDVYTKEQLSLIQSIELENLKEFVRVCKELDLNYVLYGGTLLGAEKYNGFVPWDDDIDVALPREDYEKFISYADKYLGDKWFVQSPYNEKKTPFTYTKLRMKNTKYIEYEFRNLNIDSGIYIDIYPIDKIPNDENKRKKQFKKVQKWILIYLLRQAPLYDKESKNFNDIVKKILKFILCKILKVFSQKYCLSKVTKWMKKYENDNCNRCAALNSPNYNNTYDALYPFIIIKFEDGFYNAPNDYKQHLIRRYGDYSKMPPEGKRIGHIPYILDFGPYEKVN